LKCRVISAGRVMRDVRELLSSYIQNSDRNSNALGRGVASLSAVSAPKFDLVRLEV